MPHLTFEVDRAGRPVLDLFLTQSAAEIEALEAVGHGGVQSLPVRALIDTGAGLTMIERSFVERLSLSPTGYVDVHTASTGQHPIHSPVYTIQLSIAGMANGVIAADLPVVSADDLGGLEVQILLGRNLLDRCLFFLNGPERRFTLAF